MEDDEVLAKTSRREMEDEESFLSDEVSIQETMSDLSSETRWDKLNDLFPTKRNWILVEEIQMTGIPSDLCNLCREYISVPYYAIKQEDGEEESTPVGHKVCGDLPMDLEHQLLHPGHTLRKTSVERFDGSDHRFCNACNDKKLRWYVFYDCSDCEEFVLCIKCALKLFPINHKCHPQHPVIPNHKSEEKFYCDGCSIVHEDGISYECTTCPSYRVHQYCVSPRIVKLPSHRHGLRFVYSLPETHFGEPIYCHICRQDLKGQSHAYHCARCRYFFHIFNCRSIEHFSQHASLVLVEEEGAHSESAKCAGCLLKISVPYYVSTSFPDYPLHKICAELPESVEHHLHPGHDLTLGDSETLWDSETSGDSEQICDACHKPWEGYSYYCPRASCSFSIDIICALKNIHSQKKFHQHPLIASHTKGPHACHACNIDSDGPSYKCTTCRFWVHHQCGSAPMSRKHDMHPHMLKLTYSIQDSAPEDGSSRKYHCHVCRKKMRPDDWAYHCAGCKYYIHAHDCSEPPWNREEEEFDYEAALASAIHLPAVDNESIILAKLFFMDTNKEEDTQDANGIKVGKTLFLDPDETCHMCEELLAAPCNNCALCEYFLPKSPSELDDHDSLIRGYYSMLKVSPNKTNCNGFGISFRKEGLAMKISSSVLPRYVKHGGHPHVLLTTFITERTWCSACERDIQGYVFRCNLCNFTIGPYCALLPGSVKHRYDKKHPFKLTYYSIEGVEEYVCELCEKDITTMWFYHCAECDHSIHSRCIWRFFISFGPSIRFGDYNASRLLVPSINTYPMECFKCDQEETTGCRYSVFAPSDYLLTHLECEEGPKMERWPLERRELVTRLAWLRSKEDRSKSPREWLRMYQNEYLC